MTRDDVVKLICEAPDDHKQRKMLADWFEDQGDCSTAECLRWMAVEGKRSYRKKFATWFNADKISSGLGDPESDLPEDLWKALEGGQEQANHRRYDKPEEAEEVLWRAWKKLREGGWSPPSKEERDGDAAA